MKKNINLILGVAFMVLALYSCQKTNIIELNQVKALPQAQKSDIISGRTGPAECPPASVSLIAGQHMNAGSVTVSDDGEFIYVEYATTGGWVLTQTHLYVGDCNLIPVNNSGNPKIGQFPYSSEHANLTTYTYKVPISALNGCGCVAAHAVVKQLNEYGQVIQTQTAWGNGSQINPGGSWAMKFEHCLDCDD